MSTMTNAVPLPYNKKGERWVNHTVQPGSYVVNDPRPPPGPPPAFTKPAGQTWARQPLAPSIPPHSPASLVPNHYPQGPLGQPNPHHLQVQAPPPVPIPQAFQTPKGKTPKFYDPEDFRKFTESHGPNSTGGSQPTYPTPVSGQSGRPLPAFGEPIAKRGPYSERLTRVEETELLRICLKFKETFGAPSTQNRWWQTAAADFSVYRRKNGRGDLQAPTAKRRLEQALARRRQELKEGKESDEPPEYVAALDEWVEHNDKLDKGDIQPMSSKQAAEARLDEELERIRKEKEQADKDHPLPTPPPPSSTPTSAEPRDSATGISRVPVTINDSPPAQTPPPSHPAPSHPPPFQPVYAPPHAPLTHHGAPTYHGSPTFNGQQTYHGPPPPQQFDTRPPKRSRTDDDGAADSHVGSVMSKMGSALEAMTKLASVMHEQQQSEREDRPSKRRRSATRNHDADSDGSTDSLFSPARAVHDASRLDELERNLEGQKEANALLQDKVDELTLTVTKFTEEATASETREKDRDKKIDKILQVLKKHFQGAGNQPQP